MTQSLIHRARPMNKLDTYRPTTNGYIPIGKVPAMNAGCVFACLAANAIAAARTNA